MKMSAFIYKIVNLLGSEGLIVGKVLELVLSNAFKLGRKCLALKELHRLFYFLFTCRRHFLHVEKRLHANVLERTHAIKVLSPRFIGLVWICQVVLKGRSC